jgi:hypothetical protein
MLYKHLYSDEIIPYQNLSIVRNFHKTISRHQPLGSNTSSSNSIVPYNENQSANDDASKLSGADLSKKSQQRFSKIQMGAIKGLSQTPQKQFLGKRGQALTASG